ncbi:hypothetical protein Aduo_004580 [Ancylostoma duodenale]
MASDTATTQGTSSKVQTVQKGPLMTLPTAFLTEDIEKTQNGREDEAERIVKANKYIWVAAEECFKKLEKFLDDAIKELDEVVRAEDEVGVNVETIIEKMEECERKRESIAVLSCEPPQREEMPYQTSTLLEQFMEGMRARDLNIFGSTKPSPLLERRQSDEIEKRNKMRAALFLRRMFKGKKPPPSAPQSSMDDAATQ